MIALDTNILIYAEDARDTKGRHQQAIALMDRLAPIGAVIPLQVLGEFLNVCRSKGVIALEIAAMKASLFADAFGEVPTGIGDLTEAAALSARHNLQFFDALIITVARRAGAGILLSEDLQDGLVIDGLTVVNPFVPANEAFLADLLGSAP